MFSLTNLLQLLLMFLVTTLGQVLSIYIFIWVEGDYYQEYGGVDNNRQWYEDNGQEFRLDGV